MYHIKIIRKLETDPIPKSALRNGKSIAVASRVEMPLNPSKKYIGIVIKNTVYVAEIRPIRESDLPYTTVKSNANNITQDKQKQAWQDFKDKQSVKPVVFAQGGAESNNLLKNAQTLLGALDLTHGAKEELINYAAKLSPAINEMKYVKLVKLASKGLFFVQAGVSGAQVYDAWNRRDDNKWGVTAKASLDVTIGYVCLYSGPAGWVVGGVYFIGDVVGCWGNWGEPVLKSDAGGI
jgi:hypothetical protein